MVVGAEAEDVHDRTSRSSSSAGSGARRRAAAARAPRGPRRRNWRCRLSRVAARRRGIQAVSPAGSGCRCSGSRPRQRRNSAAGTITSREERHQQQPGQRRADDAAEAAAEPAHRPQPERSPGGDQPLAGAEDHQHVAEDAVAEQVLDHEARGARTTKPWTSPSRLRRRATRSRSRSGSCARQSQTIRLAGPSTVPPAAKKERAIPLDTG